MHGGCQDMSVDVWMGQEVFTDMISNEWGL